MRAQVPVIAIGRYCLLVYLKVELISHAAAEPPSVPIPPSLVSAVPLLLTCSISLHNAICNALVISQALSIRTRDVEIC